jgi:citrate lyase beta subunit
VDFRDHEGLAAEARQGARMGFVGKQVIHPGQVEPVQGAFTPDDETIVRARRILDAYAEHQAKGTAAFELDGKMVDMPMVRAAHRVLERARAAGRFK